jgi:hypothetical protein
MPRLPPPPLRAARRPRFFSCAPAATFAAASAHPQRTLRSRNSGPYGWPGRYFLSARRLENDETAAKNSGWRQKRRPRAFGTQRAGLARAGCSPICRVTFSVCAARARPRSLAAKRRPRSLRDDSPARCETAAPLAAKRRRKTAVAAKSAARALLRPASGPRPRGLLAHMPRNIFSLRRVASRAFARVLSLRNDSPARCETAAKTVAGAKSTAPAVSRRAPALAARPSAA